jgi:nucleotide-binding universal stress UspA family protein
MYRDILVHADGSNGCARRMAAAAALAKRHEAHLVALFPLESIDMPSYVTAQIGPEVLAEARAIRLEEANRVKGKFDAVMKAADVLGEWRQETGETALVLCRHARYADLLVVSQPDTAEDAAREPTFPGELALASGRPVLVLPHTTLPDIIGSKVLVAWNGSREASRAVHDALPVLAAADSITVQEVDPPEADRIPGAEIAAHLARHGLDVEARHSVAPDIDVGDELLNAASDGGCDLVVMGAYGRSRLREAMLGGTTRHMLQNLTVPLLMSH